VALTKYKEGSVKELCVLSLPLMLSSLSVMTMVFADRWLLARYSIEAHNATVVASTLGWAFLFAWVVLANIGQVFVSQYNGAGKFEKLGEPVWQMIWVSIGTVLFFLPLFFWGGSFFYGLGSEHAYERDYFNWMMLFGPFHALYAALCGFFVGQGKTRLVTSVVVLANLLNIFFDQLLIFGLEGWVPALGVKGAAIATNIATFIQALILGIVFLRKDNRRQYGTCNWQIEPKLLWQCIRIGFPNAIFVLVEILAFAWYYELMKKMGDHYITIIGVCQTMFILLFFFFEGISKATSTIVGNLIGAGRTHLIMKVIRSGFISCSLFLCFLLAFFSFGSELIIRQFLFHADTVFINQIRDSLEICLIMTALFIFFDGIKFLFVGVLTASGDTLFLFLISSFTVWITMFLPIYVLVVCNKGSVELASMICIFYSLTAALIYFWRIFRKPWHTFIQLDTK
jgi:multidrug resistance protein, MATE family